MRDFKGKKYARMIIRPFQDAVKLLNRKVLSGVNWGSLRRLEPFCRNYGASRGKPIDRYYIDQFYEKNSAFIHGVVLEIESSFYTLKCGGDKVKKRDVLDIDPNNPKATIVADLTQATGIPDNTYDCFVLVQTLQLIYDLKAALYHSYRIVKPGGMILATLSAICRIDETEGVEVDSWRFTKASAGKLFREFFPEANVEVESYGNVLAAASFLMGLAAQELERKELEHSDKYFPILISIKAVKPG